MKSCLACSAIWGFEEIQWEKCSACGWQPHLDPDQYARDHPEHFGIDEFEEEEIEDRPRKRLILRIPRTVNPPPSDPNQLTLFD